MRTFSLLIAISLAACSGNSDKNTTDTDDTSTTDTSTTTGPDIDAIGDFSCFTPGDSFAATTWLTQNVTSSGNPVTVNGTVQDFQEETPTTNQYVSLWYADDVSKPADFNELNSEGGLITIANVPSCQPTAYLVKEKEGLNATKPTYKAHIIYADAGSVNYTFESVSNNTYASIPAILGVSLDPTKGAIAGTAYDCTRDPAMSSDSDAGKVKGSIIRVTDLEGNPAPDSAQIRYFVDNFPDPDRTYTNDDGLWVVFNLPEGDWRIESWGKINGELKLLGATVAKVYPDSINISNIYAGFGDGVKYPATCLLSTTDTGATDTDAADSGPADTGSN